MSQTELLKKYNLDERNLQALFNNIEIYLNEKHIEVIYRNLEEAIEIDVYKIDRAFKNAGKHHETCLSNGVKVWLHDNLDEVGGIAGRLYDVLHVGCGHVWQWGSDETNGLQFYGDKAWEIGSKDHLEASVSTLALVRDYEREAGDLALANLSLILEKYSLDATFSKNYIQFFTDYMNTDLEYIIDYYRHGKIKNFFDKWQFESKPFEPIHCRYDLKLKERSNNCISLISDRS